MSEPAQPPIGYAALRWWFSLLARTVSGRGTPMALKDLDGERARRVIRYGVRKTVNGTKKVVARVTIWPEIDGVSQSLATHHAGVVLVESLETGEITIFLETDDSDASA